jgi:hypothetical protein
MAAKAGTVAGGVVPLESSGAAQGYSMSKQSEAAAAAEVEGYTTGTLPSAIEIDSNDVCDDEPLSVWSSRLTSKSKSETAAAATTAGVGGYTTDKQSEVATATATAAEVSVMVPVDRDTDTQGSDGALTGGGSCADDPMVLG